MEFHDLAVFYQNLQQLHTGRYFDGFCIHIAQNTASGNQGADGAGLDVVGQYVICRRTELLLHILPQYRNSNSESDTHHQKQNQNGGDDPAFFLFPGFVQSFEQRVIALLHGFLLEKPRHVVHFILCRHRGSFHAWKALH